MALRGRSVDEDDVGRPLVVDQSLAQIGPERALGQGLVAPDDGRDHALAALLVGHAQHGRFAHAGALVDHPLDDLGIDVESVGDDQVVLTSHQGEEPGRVAGAQVAGVEPAGSERLAGGVRLVASTAGTGSARGAEPSRPRPGQRACRRR